MRLRLAGRTNGAAIRLIITRTRRTDGRDGMGRGVTDAAQVSGGREAVENAAFAVCRSIRLCHGADFGVSGIVREFPTLRNLQFPPPPPRPPPLPLSPSAPSTTVQFDWIYSIQQQLDDCISKGLTLLDDYAITYTGYTYGHTGIHAYMYTVHACIGYISYSWYRVKSSAYLQPTDYGCMCVYNYLLLP